MSLVSIFRETVIAAKSGMFSATFLLFLLIAGCQPTSLQEEPQATPPAMTQNSNDLQTLPLPLGYYVASDIPCAKASNATLLLLQRHGIGGARDFCEFTRIEQTGTITYRVEESCADFQGGDPEKRAVQYEIKGGQRFLIKEGDITLLDARYCAQSELPAEWRETTN